MKFRTDEIASVLKQEIQAFGHELDMAAVGRVVEVGDGIARIYGLSGAMAGELLQFQNGSMGQVFNLESDSVGAVIYGEYQGIKEGDSVRSTGELLSVPVGAGIVGRVVDPLGQPLDGKGPIAVEAHRPVDIVAPGIAFRQPVNEPLYSGIKAIDSMIPIGRGQRELIIGDRKTGKSSIAVDTILSQLGGDVFCVYVAIGAKESTIAETIETFENRGAMKHTTVVMAGSSDPAPMLYLAPYAGCAIAEHFMYAQGRPTLVVYDDLSKHAAAYRQMSLLLRRPPGREAYPGDIFYLHSRLLERACKLADRYIIAAKDASVAAGATGVDGKVYERPEGRADAEQALKARKDAEKLQVAKLPDSGGSLTALPIVETLEGEISAYIPTNLISITDGQIYLEPGLFLAGIRPAVNVGYSVSRVGGAAQIQAMKRVAASLRLDLAAYRELQAFSQLDTDVSATTQRQLDRGARMVELLKQPLHVSYPVADQVVSIFAGTRGHLDKLPLTEVAEYEKGLLAYVRQQCASLYGRIVSTKQLSKEDEAELEAAVQKYDAEWKARTKPAAE